MRRSSPRRIVRSKRTTTPQRARRQPLSRPRLASHLIKTPQRLSSQPPRVLYRARLGTRVRRQKSPQTLRVRMLMKRVRKRRAHGGVGWAGVRARPRMRRRMRQPLRRRGQGMLKKVQRKSKRVLQNAHNLMCNGFRILLFTRGPSLNLCL